MIPRAHIIGTQVLDVEIDVGEDFFALQQEVSQMFQARVAPALDALFSRYAEADTVIRLDRLEVDVGRIDRAHLEDELATRIIEALEPVLAAQLGEVVSVRAPVRPRLGVQRPAGEAEVTARDAIEKSALEEAALEGGDAEERAIEGGSDAGRVIEEEAVGSRTIEGHTIELWHYFLQTGHFPWWATALEPSDFETRVRQALAAQPAFLVQTRAVVQQAPAALQRLVLQFSDAFLDHLVRAYTPALSPRLLQIVQDFSRWAAAHPASGVAPRAFREVFWQEALDGLFTGLPKAATRAEEAVVRRALQRLSRRLSVAYPDLLARIQATLQQQEPEATTAPGLLVRRFVQALAPPAGAAEAAKKAAVPSDSEPAYPARAPEETQRPEHAAESEAEAQAEAETRPRTPDDPAEVRREPAGSEHPSSLDVSESEAAKQPSRTGAPEAAADDPVEAHREPAGADAERRPDGDALAARLPEEERQFLEDDEQQRAALHGAASEESNAPSPPALSSEAAEGTTGAAERKPADEDADAASQILSLDEEAAPEAVAARVAKDAAIVRGEALAQEDRPLLADRPAPKPIKEGAEFYLRNAGLVLLHPYLTAHFEHLGLVEEKAFVDEDARHKAIYQLQYLATGQTQALEYSLTLNKLLCGHPLEHPIARDIVLGEAAHAEAEDLLRAVIRNWPALKNTSPDGLREGFLQRDGKLTRKPFTWLLQVEQKSYDILLGRLPWGLGIVKLPWMPEMLHVEWA